MTTANLFVTPPELVGVLGNLNLKTAAGRLEFYRRWCGGNDRDHIYYIKVNARIAQWLLKHLSDEVRITNRIRSLVRLKEYRRMMSKGEWFSRMGWPLVYDAEGRVANGFGRLLAIAGLPNELEFPICGPWCVNAILAIDDGHGRTEADKASIVWGLEKHEQPALYAQMASVIRLHLIGPQPTRGNGAENKELASQFVDAYREFHKLIPRGGFHKVFRRPDVIGAFCYAYRNTLDTRIWELWQAIIKGRNLADGSPLADGSAEQALFETIHHNSASKDAQRLRILRKLLHGISSALGNSAVRSLRPHKHLFKNEVWTAHYFDLAGLIGGTP